jgi:DNA-directed RNA polymerase specialized sigma24 family protein
MLDEKHAVAAATEAVKKLKSRSLENDNSKDELEKSIVFFCSQVRKEFKQKKRLLWAKNFMESSWIVPKEVDLGPWREFSTDEKEEVVDAVIFSKILGFNEAAIARGLGITAGTLRYRIGNGVRHLGAVVQPGANVI